MRQVSRHNLSPPVSLRLHNIIANYAAGTLYAPRVAIICYYADKTYPSSNCIVTNVNWF